MEGFSTDGCSLSMPLGQSARCSGRVYHGSTAQRSRARRQCRRAEFVRSHDVHYLDPPHEKIVADDATMATPPKGLGAHDCAVLQTDEFKESVQANMECLGCGVVRISPKRRIGPEGIGRGRCITCVMSPAAKRGNVLVTDTKLTKRCWERVDIELRIGTGSGKRPDIDHHLDPNRSQQRFELRRGAVRVADGVRQVWHSQ